MMRKVLKFALLVFLFNLCRLHANESLFVPVLVYHNIEKQVQSDVSCVPAQFASHMYALVDNGFTPLTLSQFRLFLAGAVTDYEKPILITFDDGYEGIYDYAFPIAKELQIPMTVFMITSRISRRLQFARYLNSAQISKMHESGLFDFGSHSHDLHTDVKRIYSAFERADKNPVVDLVKRDLAISSHRLYEITKQKPYAIAWPYGSFNDSLTRAARSKGYFLHFTSQRGHNEPGANPYAIKRIVISSRDTPETLLFKTGHKSYLFGIRK